MLKKQPPKIIFTGPESSGKSTMTKLAAEHFEVPFLEEYSRNFLNNLGRNYLAKDLITIAEGQLASEKQFTQNNQNHPYLFFDTSLLVIKVWSIFKYGFYNIRLEKLLLQNLPDYYFLCDWQIPWEYDPLRETPNDRGVLYQLYKRELEDLGVPFMEINGSEMERLTQVKFALRNISD